MKEGGGEGAYRGKAQMWPETVWTTLSGSMPGPHVAPALSSLVCRLRSSHRHGGGLPASPAATITKRFTPSHRGQVVTWPPAPHHTLTPTQGGANRLTSQLLSTHSENTLNDDSGHYSPSLRVIKRNDGVMPKTTAGPSCAAGGMWDGAATRTTVWGPPNSWALSFYGIQQLHSTDPPRRKDSGGHLHTVLTAALFTAAQKQKEPKGLSTGEQSVLRT